jgi:hypothetical protein
MARTLLISTSIGVSIACIFVVALTIAGRPVRPALLFGIAHGLGALMLAAALSGLFTCAAFATSFVFVDARAQPRHGALLTIAADGHDLPG